MIDMSPVLFLRAFQFVEMNNALLLHLEMLLIPDKTTSQDDHEELNIVEIESVLSSINNDNVKLQKLNQIIDMVGKVIEELIITHYLCVVISYLPPYFFIYLFFFNFLIGKIFFFLNFIVKKHNYQTHMVHEE